MGTNQFSERRHTQAGDGLWIARSVSVFMIGVVVGTTWQDGSYTTRGFRGRYQVLVTYGGVTHAFDTTLDGSMANLAIVCGQAGSCTVAPP